MVASTWITPGCVQFLKNKKRFHTAWDQTGSHLSESEPALLTQFEPRHFLYGHGNVV